jgi:hypothetical protein
MVIWIKLKADVKTHFELQIHDTRLNYGNLDEIQS